MQTLSSINRDYRYVFVLLRGGEQCQNIIHEPIPHRTNLPSLERARGCLIKPWQSRDVWPQSGGLYTPTGIRDASTLLTTIIHHSRREGSFPEKKKTAEDGRGGNGGRTRGREEERKSPSSFEYSVGTYPVAHPGFPV